MSENYGIDDAFFKEVQDSVKGAILEKQLLKPEEKQEIIDVYKKHVAIQLKLENVRERTLFTDKYGATICLILTPMKIVNKGVHQNAPKVSSNGSFRLWGFNLPLLNKFNKNTMFGDTKSDLVGYNQKILARGSMTKKFKYGTENSMFESAFVKHMKDIYAKIKPDREVKTLEDIDYIDYFDDYTFNIWETLIHWGGNANE